MSIKGKVLTRELVFNKTRSDNIQAIKNLNLWGNELEDLKLIQKMPNLEVISLSVNCISSLKDFATCQKLQELYLRKNCIADIKEIRYILKLPFLKILWLQDNPCATTANYRQIVIHHLPNLVKLDNNIISQEEREFSQNQQFQLKGINCQSSNVFQEKPFMPQEAQKIVPQTSSDRRSRQYSDAKIQENVSKESSNWREGSSKKVNKNLSYHQPVQVPEQQAMNRNRNILIAILSLMKELDEGSLQIVRKQTDRLINESG